MYHLWGNVASPHLHLLKITACNEKYYWRGARQTLPAIASGEEEEVVICVLCPIIFLAWDYGFKVTALHLKNTWNSCSGTGRFNFFPIWFSHLEIWGKSERHWSRPSGLTVSVASRHLPTASVCILMPGDFIWHSGISLGPRYMEIQKFWKINCPTLLPSEPPWTNEWGWEMMYK